MKIFNINVTETLIESGKFTVEKLYDLINEAVQHYYDDFEWEENGLTPITPVGQLPIEQYTTEQYNIVANAYLKMVLESHNESDSTVDEEYMDMLNTILNKVLNIQLPPQFQS